MFDAVNVVLFDELESRVCVVIMIMIMLASLGMFLKSKTLNKKYLGPSIKKRHTIKMGRNH
jgi:hypothetical protein